MASTKFGDHEWALLNSALLKIIQGNGKMLYEATPELKKWHGKGDLLKKVKMLMRSARGGEEGATMSKQQSEHLSEGEATKTTKDSPTKGKQSAKEKSKQAVIVIDATASESDEQTASDSEKGKEKKESTQSMKQRKDQAKKVVFDRDSGSDGEIKKGVEVAAKSTRKRSPTKKIQGAQEKKAKVDTEEVEIEKKGEVRAKAARKRSPVKKTEPSEQEVGENESIDEAEESMKDEERHKRQMDADSMKTETSSKKRISKETSPKKRISRKKSTQGAIKDSDEDGSDTPKARPEAVSKPESTVTEAKSSVPTPPPSDDDDNETMAWSRTSSDVEVVIDARTSETDEEDKNVTVDIGSKSSSSDVGDSSAHALDSKRQISTSSSASEDEQPAKKRSKTRA